MFNSFLFNSPAFGAPAAGGGGTVDPTKQPLSAALTEISGLTPSNDDLLQRKAGVWTNRTIAQVKSDLGISAYALLAGAVFVGAVSVPDDPYDATSWNNSLEVATKNAIRDKIEALGGGGNAQTTNPLSQFASTTSSQLAGVMSDETGGGLLVFNNSPVLITPSFGSIVNSGTLTLPTSTDTLVGRNTTDTLVNKTLTSPIINVGSDATGDIYYRNSGGAFTRLAIGTTGQVLNVGGSGVPAWATSSGGGNAQTANPLSQFASTTSSQLAGVMSDETGSGALVFATSPTLVTPILGTPTSGTLTNCTGLPHASIVGDKVEIGIACSDETTAITTGTAKVTFRMPYAMTLTAVRANVNTAPTGSTILIDINEGGTTVLSTKLMIDASENTSTTATTAYVISDSALADDAEITIDFDQVGSTIAGKGVKVWLLGVRA